MTPVINLRILFHNGKIKFYHNGKFYRVTANCGLTTQAWAPLTHKEVSPAFGLKLMSLAKRFQNIGNDHLILIFDISSQSSQY